VKLWGVTGTIRRGLGIASAALASAMALGCEKEVQEGLSLRAESTRQVGPITRIEPVTGLDPARVALGEKLFHEPRLSGNGALSCSGCHDLSRAGVDRLPLSFGISGQPTHVNTPTVFNAALNFRQFWDGRAISLEDQVEGPLLGPDEMGSSCPSVLSILQADAAFAQRFKESYRDGVTPANVKNALATFERSLSTPDAPFDRYLAGVTDSVGQEAVHGYELFTSYGCSSCHQGRSVGGNMFQRLGIGGDYSTDRGHETEADLGRFNVTHDEADRYVFKVPSLRNVARTAPYFHDGTVTQLDEAVRLMARYQLVRDLDDADVRSLVAFLESLTGEYRGRPL
jgi:cytochrome c peroxidase